MKKYIIAAMTALVIMIAGLSLYSVHKRKHYYDKIEVHSKLLKEIVVDTKDSACYKEWGIYKKVYRKYNYAYTDSVIGGYNIDDTIYVSYAVTDVGDTVYMMYTDCNSYKRDK